MLNQYLSAFVLMIVALAAAAGLIALNWLAGHVSGSRTKTYPYECGSLLLDTSKRRTHIRFYVIAMMFILFDIEAAFLYPWAVMFRSLGMFGFMEMLLFLTILVLGYIYIWRRGAFAWD